MYEVGDFFKNQVSQINTKLPLFSLKTMLQHCGKKYFVECDTLHLIVFLFINSLPVSKRTFCTKNSERTDRK